MQRIDLREYKGELRLKAREYRASLSEKEKNQLDGAIYSRLIATYQYRECKVLLIYASTAIEVDTSRIINHALQNGRRVALPRCIKGTRDMVFHYITDIGQLESGAFGVMEPQEHLPEWQQSDGGLAVVPALMLDGYGYRLGYGGGYYDRFLSGFKGDTVGITYSANYCNRLNHGRYDVPLGAVLTDSFVKRIRSDSRRNENE